MADPYAVTSYFQNKANHWIEQDGSVEAHVRRLGKNGLAQEFQADAGFRQVCELVQEYGELQSRSHIVQSLEGLVGDQFGLPLVGEMDVVIGAMALACGFETLGSQLVKVGALAIGVFVLAGIMTAILSGGRK